MSRLDTSTDMGSEKSIETAPIISLSPWFLHISVKMHYSFMMTPHIIWHGSLREPLFRLERQGKFKRKSAWFPSFGRCSVSTVFLHCVLGCGAMQSSFAHMFFLTSKGTYLRELAEGRIEASICNFRMHGLTMSNGRDKKLPERNPRRLSIPKSLWMLLPATSSCLAI
jgi:hypothetical protein